MLVQSLKKNDYTVNILSIVDKKGETVYGAQLKVEFAPNFIPAVTFKHKTIEAAIAEAEGYLVHAPLESDEY